MKLRSKIEMPKVWILSTPHDEKFLDKIKGRLDEKQVQVLGQTREENDFLGRC